MYQRGPQPHNPYYPFESKTDYAMSAWLSQHKLSKGAVDDLTKRGDLEQIQEHLGFTNADKWHDKLERIPWGIQDDRWIQKSFKIDSNFERATSSEYTIYYRPIINVIEFLLGMHHLRKT